MSDLRKAAHTALEAWDRSRQWPFPTRPDKEFDALRAALAQPEPFNPDWDRVEALEASLREHMAEIHRLKALAQPEQEPVAWMQESTGCIRSDWGFDKTGYVPLYTAPPQRKPLTEADIKGILEFGLQTWKLSESTVEFARAIEAAHGIE
jgi:hypothetical protein